MSQKRKLLGFDEESDNETSLETSTHRKRVNLPKLKLISNEAPLSSESIILESPPKDRKDDYLSMKIEEDENSKPQKLQIKGEKPPTDYYFTNIRDEIKTRKTSSLFGQITSKLDEQNQALKELPNTQLMSKSKGLSIMEKMGFKIGQSLGKNSFNESALLEPLEQIQRNGREGLKQKITVNKHEAIVGVTTKDTIEFRTRLNDEQNEKRLESIYHKMQKYCYEFSGDATFDIQKINSRDVNVLWRSYIRYIQSLLKKRQIEEVLDKEKEEEEEKVDESEDEELDLFNEMKISKKIERLNLHLRSEYDYCFYCGAKYDSQKDLFEHCPGKFEDDHQ